MPTKKTSRKAKSRGTRRRGAIARRLTALVVRGKTLKTAPGYYFQKSGKGLALMRRGTKTVDFNCECSGSGGCRVEIQGQTATCLESGCTGSCGWVVQIPGIRDFPGLSVLA